MNAAARLYSTPTSAKARALRQALRSAPTTGRSGVHDRAPMDIGDVAWPVAQVRRRSTPAEDHAAGRLYGAIICYGTSCDPVHDGFGANQLRSFRARRLQSTITSSTRKVLLDHRDQRLARMKARSSTPRAPRRRMPPRRCVPRPDPTAHKTGRYQQLQTRLFPRGEEGRRVSHRERTRRRETRPWDWSGGALISVKLGRRWRA